MDTQPDLKDLMKSSPGLQTLPPEELAQLIDSVDTLPEANRQQILQAMVSERSELEKIEGEFDAKKNELYDEYQAYMHEEKVKMAMELRLQMEKTERVKEEEILSGLLKELDGV